MAAVKKADEALDLEGEEEMLVYGNIELCI
jgi:hypothetical protein